MTLDENEIRWTIMDDIVWNGQAKIQLICLNLYSLIVALIYDCVDPYTWCQAIHWSFWYWEGERFKTPNLFLSCGIKCSLFATILRWCAIILRFGLFYAFHNVTFLSNRAVSLVTPMQAFGFQLLLVLCVVHTLLCTVYGGVITEQLTVDNTILFDPKYKCYFPFPSMFHVLWV